MALPTEAVDVPSLPFAGCSGVGVRVAVIDSGVNRKHPHISHIEGGICIGSDAAVGEGDYSDYLGHGTAVTAAIQEKAPGAKYFAVRLFQASLRTSTEGLFNAIDWAIGQRMDAVNLSLGTRNAVHAPRFTGLIQRGLDCGVLMVAAREADGDRCYPGSLPGAISVGLDWDCPRERFRCEQTADGPVFYASGYPRSLPGMPRERNLNGISFAVANMCGFVARACEAVAKNSREGKPAPEAVRQALIAEGCAIPRQ